MQITTRSHIEQSASAEEIAEQIMAERGYRDDAQRKLFLHPPRPTLASLLSFTKLKKTTLTSLRTMVDSHVAAGDDICVFGDYDADGITSTAIMWQALMYYTKGKKVRILPFLPDRHRHGYGLSVKAIEEMYDGTAFRSTHYPDFSPKLVVTVDNGIVAHEAVKMLKSKHVDVVVTDHHEPSGLLPAADLIVHTKATSGAGIAWIVALFLLGESTASYALIDLATVGIVADMIPLTGGNRSIIVHGLSALTATHRPGLRALYTAAGIEGRALTTYDINFGIAPRVNAAGRLYDPYDALRLVCATNESIARDLATKINTQNQDRQMLTDQALRAAEKESFDHKIVVVVGDYHEGIVGLVAGKLVEKLYKPAIVMSLQGDTVKASARSVTGVNITELLRSLEVPFLGLGGHAAAAGFSIEKSKLNEFRDELYNVADATIPDALLEKKMVVDGELTPGQVTLKLAHLVSEMEPFGMGNPKPKFLFRDLDVLEDRELGVAGKHHKLTVAVGGKSLEILLFNTREHHPVKHIPLLVATVDVNVWRDRESVQLIASYVETAAK